jgi:hypothetical protein
MKQILKELSFEYLPMLSEFITAYDNSILYYERNDMAVIVPYKDLITQPLTLSQFVACKDGVPMEEPVYNGEPSNEQYYSVQREEYQKAVDAVIFEGWELTINVHGSWWVEKDGQCIKSGQTIESFINNGGKLKFK